MGIFGVLDGIKARTKELMELGHSPEEAHRKAWKEYTAKFNKENP